MTLRGRKGPDRPRDSEVIRSEAAKDTAAGIYRDVDVANNNTTSGGISRGCAVPFPFLLAGGALAKHL